VWSKADFIEMEKAKFHGGRGKDMPRARKSVGGT
jgi:hypothetical protein